MNVDRVTPKFMVELKFFDKDDLLLCKLFLSWENLEKYLLEELGGYEICDIVVERLMSDGIFKFGKRCLIYMFGQTWYDFNGYINVSQCLHSLIHAGVVPFEKQAVANHCFKLNIYSFFSSEF